MKKSRPSSRQGPASYLDVFQALRNNRPGFPIKLLVAILASLAGMVAVASAQSGAARSPEILSHLQKGEEYLKARDSDSAANEFEAVLALDPKNAEAYANLGTISFFQRNYRGASLNFRKALAIDPSLTKTQALMGICEKRMGEPSARATLEKSFAKLKDKQLRLQVGMELATLYDQQGNSGAMVSVMQRLVNLDPDNVDVLFMAQRVYAELADDTLNKLAMLAPGSALMQQVIAERLVNQGDLKGAIEHYRNGLQIDSRLPGVRFELGEAILESAPADATAQAQARGEMEEALTFDGDSAKTECELGSIALLQSQPDQALEHYRRAYQLDPNEVQAQMGLANLLIQEKPQEALKYLRMAVQSDPLNGSAHYHLAQAYRRLQMADAAEKEMHLFQEIKAAKRQVQVLYQQMNRQMKPEADQIVGKGIVND